jgi:hypothetical protein
MLWLDEVTRPNERPRRLPGRPSNSMKSNVLLCLESLVSVLLDPIEIQRVLIIEVPVKIPATINDMLSKFLLVMTLFLDNLNQLQHKLNNQLIHPQGSCGDNLNLKTAL